MTAVTNVTQAGNGVPTSAVAPEGSAAEIAARYGLTPPGLRPSLGQYLVQLWRRRSFITAYTHARLTVKYSRASLGQVWHVLTPLLSIGVYFLVWGVLLKTSRGNSNFIAFLSVGMFVFTYTRESISMGMKSIADRLALIRAVQFPRAALPISSTLLQLEQLVFSLGVAVVIVLASGEPLTMRWLYLFPALALQTVFNLGLALLLSRVGAVVRDLSELIPFLLRTWMYLSGVFYSIDKVTGHAGIIRTLMEANPAAIFIELARFALINSQATLTPHAWSMAAVWAVVALVTGLVFCWRAEDRYGRG